MRRLQSSTGLCCILLCSICTLSNAQSKPAEQHPSKQQQETTSNSCPRCPTCEAPQCFAVTESKAQGDQDKSDKKITKRERAIRWISDIRAAEVVMGILTLAYVLTTAFLLIAVRKQAEIATSGERAWLWEYSAPNYQPQQGGAHGRCSVGFRNFGKSPAWIISIGAGFQWIHELDDLPKKPSYGDVPWSSVDPVGPSGAEDAYYTFVTSNFVEGTRDSNSRLAVFVSVEYRDRFNLSEKEKPRKLRYCFVATAGYGPNWRKEGPRGYNEYT